MRVLPAIRRDWTLRALVLLAFVTRALIPPGFMLQPASDGVAVVLCSAAGWTDAAVDPARGQHATKHAPGKQSGTDEPPCTFAGLAKLATLTPDLIVTAPVDASVLAPTPLTLSPGRGLSAPPPPATGPPTHI